MDPLFTFLFAGFVSMSAALSAKDLNQLPEEQRVGRLASRNMQVAVVVAGNLAALTLIGALAFGMRQLEWWIPLLCVFITFPVVHIVVFQKLWGAIANLALMTLLVLVAIPALYYYW